MSKIDDVLGDIDDNDNINDVDDDIDEILNDIDNSTSYKKPKEDHKKSNKQKSKKKKSEFEEIDPTILNDKQVDEKNKDLIDTTKNVKKDISELRNTIKSKSDLLCNRYEEMLEKHFNIIEKIQNAILGGNIHHAVLKSYSSLIDSVAKSTETIFNVLNNQKEIIEEENFEEGGDNENGYEISDDLLLQENVSKEQIEKLIKIEEEKLKNSNDSNDDNITDNNNNNITDGNQ